MFMFADYGNLSWIFGKYKSFTCHVGSVKMFNGVKIYKILILLKYCVIIYNSFVTCVLFVATSIEYPSRPITKQYVRATNYPAGYAVAQKKRLANIMVVLRSYVLQIF